MIICFFVVLMFTTKASAGELTACTYKSYQVPAPSLQGAVLPNAEEQPLYVYLPADYEESDKDYGVVYFFNGFGCGADIDFIASAVDELMQRSPCILVSVMIRNDLGGSFATNSSVTGNWEDYVCNDVIPYVDSHFRTKAQSKYRAICGHSMGGYAVLKLGLRHADLFGSVYSVDPGLFDANGLLDAMPTWDQYFLNAYGAAMAPNPSKPYPHADIPVFDGSDADFEIQKLWFNGFGGAPDLIETYLGGESRLDHLYVDSGVNDQYPWIPNGCMAFSRMLFDAKIPHNLVITDEGHWMDSNIFLSRVGEKTFSWVSE